jgi:serine/threonine-protein kinase
LAQTLTQVGKYRIDRELGRGAMGVVYKAFDTVVERPVAIKTIRLDVDDAEGLAARLRREAKSVGQLEHTNIVTLYDAGESNGLFYLAMQFIEGETLQSRLERERWFTLKETLEMFAQICSGLDYAHSRGVIHRDIKPANIMITSNGVVKLTDFGIAKLTNAGASTSGLILGTPSYMSPEQAIGKPLDGRSDIFSLGSILYELLTGEKAFAGQNVTTVIYKIVHESPTPVLALQPGMDPAVEPIVLKALAKNPDARFQTCQELALALETYVNNSIAGSFAISPTLRGPQSPATSAAIASGAQSPIASAAGMTAAPQPIMPTAAGGALTTGTTAAPPGMSAAWVAIGALGALLLVVVVMLVLQMRKPAAPNVATRATLGGPVTTLPARPSPASNTESAAAKPEDKPPTQVGSQPAKSAASKGTSAARKPGDHSSRITEVVPPATKPPVAHQQTAKNQQAVPPAQPEQPETFSALLLRGDLAYQQSHYEDALASYKKAYLLNSKNAEVKRKITVVLTLLGRPEEASKYQ